MASGEIGVMQRWVWERFVAADGTARVVVRLGRGTVVGELEMAVAPGAWPLVVPDALGFVVAWDIPPVDPR